MEPTRMELLDHELRQIESQMKQLHEWIEPVLKEITHLKCWRMELLEQREAEMRSAIRVTRCQPGPGPDRPSKRSKPVTDPVMAKLSKMSAAQLAHLMALMEEESA